MHRNVRTADLVLLWARAAGMCSHPDCKVRLVIEGSDDDPGVTVGEACHIVARRDGGPRGDSGVLACIRNGYENLILLCGHHHAIVDRDWERHSVEALRGWKAEHEGWVKSVTGRVAAAAPWTAIVQDDEGKVDLGVVRAAVGAGNVVERVVVLRGESAEAERAAVERVLAETAAEKRRFAVFSVGRIPLAVQLGHVLGDRSRVAVYHYDRDRGSWAWRAPEGGAGVSVRSRKWQRRGGEAVIRVSLSARVGEVPVKGSVEVEVAAERPSVRWLRSEEQLRGLAVAYEEALRLVRGAERTHLFYAGPGAGSVGFGRGYGGRMNGELVVWEWRRGRYYEALRVNGR
jgi:hypothetical protein